MKYSLSRRDFTKGGGCLAVATLAGCATTAQKSASLDEPKADSRFALQYSARPNEQFPLPALSPEDLPAQYRRKRVDYDTGERPGTVIVDTSSFYLYHVEPDGKATRYGVGLGRAGFEWSGRARIAWKRPWPKWTPPDSMIKREPELEKWSVRNGGMPPGLKNPLGARALYIFEGNVDTLYRLHGTNQPKSIGKAVSSGCVRMINQDAIDLYDRVKTGSPILVV